MFLLSKIWLFIFGIKNAIYVEHIQNRKSVMEKCSFVTPRVVKTKNGNLLALVPPSERIYKGKVVKYYLRLNDEIFLRDNEYNVINEDRKLQCENDKQDLILCFMVEETSRRRKRTEIIKGSRSAEVLSCS